MLSNSKGYYIEYMLIYCFNCFYRDWHGPCYVSRITGMVRQNTKEPKMSLSSRTQIVSVFAAVFCAFITIGISVAPAVAPIAGYVA